MNLADPLMLIKHAKARDGFESRFCKCESNKKTANCESICESRPNKNRLCLKTCGKEMNTEREKNKKIIKKLNRKTFLLNSES